MTTSTLTTVIDLLVAKFQGLDLTVDGEPVQVYDGVEGPDEEENFVVVMGWPDEGGDESEATQEVAYIGEPVRMFENYDVAVVVSCFKGGDASTGTNGPENAQATVRANERTIQSAIETAMTADPNLAIQNGGTAPVIWCLLRSTRYSQRPPFSEEGAGAMGRFANCLMRFHTYALIGGN